MLTRNSGIALAAVVSLAACSGTTSSNGKTNSPSAGGETGNAGASAAGGAAAGGSSGGGEAGNAGGGVTGSGGKSGTGAGGSAPSDGGSAHDAGCDDAITAALSWGSNGGLVRYQDTSKLEPPRAYTHLRDMGTNAAPVTCHTEVAGCPSQVIAELDRALGNATVKSALAAHTVYGVDSRPVDGTVFRIQVGAGYIDVGAPCGTPASGCTAIPDVIRSLADGLRALDATELAKPACSGLFP